MFKWNRIARRLFERHFVVAAPPDQCRIAIHVPVSDDARERANAEIIFHAPFPRLTFHPATLTPALRDLTFRVIGAEYRCGVLTEVRVAHPGLPELSQHSDNFTLDWEPDAK